MDKKPKYKCAGSLLFGEDFLERFSHEFGGFVLIFLEDHRFAHAVKGARNSNGGRLQDARLVERVDFVEQILQVILPSQFVLPEHNVATSEWAHGFCASWFGPIKTTRELVVQVHVRWQAVDFVLAENGNVDHMPAQKHAGEPKVHREDEKLLSVVGGVLENAAPTLVETRPGETSSNRLGQKRRADHRRGRVDDATRQIHSRLVHFLSTSVRQSKSDSKMG